MEQQPQPLLTEQQERRDYGIQDEESQDRITAADVNRPEVKEKLRVELQKHNSISNELTATQQAQMRQLLERYSDTMLNNLANSGPLEEELMVRLDVEDPLRKQRTRQLELSFKSTHVLQRLIEKYYSEKIVEPSSETNWNTPLFVIRKPNKPESELSSYRVLADVRELNKQLLLNERMSGIPLVSKLFAFVT